MIMFLTGKYLLIYLSPMCAAIGIAIAMGYLLHLREQKDICILGISALLPVLFSISTRLFKDERDLVKNFKLIVKMQYAALPLVPITFFLLQHFIPKQLSAQDLVYNLNIFLYGILACLFIRKVLKPREPWRIKLSLQLLKSELLKQKKNIGAPYGRPDSYSLTPGLKVQLLKLNKEIARLYKLPLKKAADYKDKAGVYLELGHIAFLTQEYQDAEKNYVNALEAHNDAKELEPGDAPQETDEKAELLRYLELVRGYLNAIDKDG